MKSAQDIRKEDLEVINELENEKLNDINLKEIDTLLSSKIDQDTQTTAGKTSEKNLNANKKVKPSVKLSLTQAKTFEPKGQNSHIGIKESKGSTKKILDAIIQRISSQHHRGALEHSRTKATPGLVETKKAGNQENKTLLSSDNLTVQKATEKTQNSSPRYTKIANKAKKAQSQRDSIVFSRLEAIAHNILRVLRHRDNSNQGSKVHYKINRDDLLKIRDFIKTTRDPSIERKIKVHSAKGALTAIKNLMKLIKRNKLGNDKLRNTYEAAKAADSHAFSKSKVPKDDKNRPESKERQQKPASVLANNGTKPEHNKKYYLEKLKMLRIKLLKDKLLRVLRMRDGDKLNVDLKRLKSKLEKQEKREKRNEEPVKQEHKKQTDKEKAENKSKTKKISHKISKELRNIIQKKIQKLKTIMKKQEGAVERGTKRFLLARGPSSFRKNLISLENLDANKMTNEDLKRLHDKINEWIEVEEKLERGTENGEAKDEISSGINDASDLLSSLQLADVNGKKVDENKENEEKKNLEITIDINKHGKNDTNPSISIKKVNGNEVEIVPNESQQDNKMYTSNGNPTVANSNYPTVTIPPENNMINGATVNIDATNAMNQASKMYSNNGNPAVTNNDNPSQLTSSQNIPNGNNEERNRYKLNGNAAEIEKNPNIPGSNPGITNPSGSRYLKEMAKAYMDGKAISENQNFGEKMKKLEENFENNVNYLENNNNNNILNNKESLENPNTNKQNDYNKNLPSNNLNEFEPKTVGDFGSTSTQQGPINSGNKNILQNNQDYNEKNLKSDQNIKNKEQFQQMSNSGSNNDKFSAMSGYNALGNTINSGDSVSKDFNKNIATSKDVNSYTVNGNTAGNNFNDISNKKKVESTNADQVGHNIDVSNGGQVSNVGQAPSSDQAANTKQFKNGGQMTNVGQIANKGQFANGGQVANGDQVVNEGKDSGGNQVTNVGQAPSSDQAADAGQLKNGGQVASGGQVGNEEQVVNAGKDPNTDRVTNVSWATDEGKATNQGQLGNGGQATNQEHFANGGKDPDGGQVTNTDQVSSNDQVANAGQVTNIGKAINEGILPNGHVITNVADVTNKQTQLVNIQNPETQQNINNAVNQLVTTMNQDNPTSVTAGKQHSVSNQPGKLKEIHPAKKLKVTNPDYDDQDYDYSEAEKEQEDDEANIAEQEKQLQNKTPFLQSGQTNKLIPQHNPEQNVPPANLPVHSTSLSHHNDGPQNMNQNPNIKTSRPTVFHRVNSPTLNQPTALNTAPKMPGTIQNIPNKQRLILSNSHQLNERIDDDQNTGTDHNNLGVASSGKLSNKLKQHSHSVHTFSRREKSGQPLQQVGLVKQETKTESNKGESDQTQQENGVHGFILNGKEIQDDRIGENTIVKTDQAKLSSSNENKIRPSDMTSEHVNPGNGNSEENIAHEDPKPTDVTVNNAELNTNLHGKALLDNFLDEERSKETHSSQSVTQSLNTAKHNVHNGKPHKNLGSVLNGKAMKDEEMRDDETENKQNEIGVDQNSEEMDETKSRDNLDEEVIRDDHSSKTNEGVPEGSNTGPHNSQVQSTKTDNTESTVNLDQDPTKASSPHNSEALSAETDDMQPSNDNSDVPQYSAKLVGDDDEEVETNSNTVPSMRNVKHWNKHHRIKKARHRFYQLRKHHKPILHKKTKYRSHRFPVHLILKNNKHVQNTDNIQSANETLFNQTTVDDLQQNTKPKAIVNLKKIPDTDALIRGALRSIPSEIIHIVKTQPKLKPVATKSGAKVMTVSNETAMNEDLTFVMPKLKKVKMEVNSLGRKETTNLQDVKFIENEAHSNDQKSSSGGGGGGGLETSSIRIPGSQIAAQSLVGENKMANLNSNDVTSSHEMAPSNDVDRMASSTDPTDLTEYEHRIDIAERTGAGDIVPVGVGTNNPSVSPVSENPSQNTPTGGQGAPPEHVLLSPNSAKGEDLLKPLGNDPDGKLAAIQDIGALTKAQKEQETNQDPDKISDPAFLEGMSNRVSVSGTPLNTMEMANTPSIPLRDVDQPGSTIMIPGEKLKRDEKGAWAKRKTGGQDKNAQFTVDNKVVALRTGSNNLKFATSPKNSQLHSVAIGQQTEKPAVGGQVDEHEAALTSAKHNLDTNLAPRIAQLVKEIIRESLGNRQVLSEEKTQKKATKEILDEPSKDAEVLLKSEKLETKPYHAPTDNARKENGAISQVSQQVKNLADSSKASVFLPHVPSNPEGDQLFLGGESHPADIAGTMNTLSESNLSKEEKLKLIKEYQESQKTSHTATGMKPSKAESSPASPEVEESKIQELLRNGKFNEHDLKSDFAGKEAAMQDMMLLEKERDIDDKLSQAHLMASQPSKQKGPGGELAAGSQRQNAMSLPGNLSPDITLPGNISPGASLPEALPAGTSPLGNGLSTNIGLPGNRLPGIGSQGEISGFQGQIPGSRPHFFSKLDASMMDKETRMAKLLEQAQGGMPKGQQRDHNVYGSRKV